MHAVDADHPDDWKSRQREEEAAIFESAGQGENSRPDVALHQMNHRLEIPVFIAKQTHKQTLVSEIGKYQNTGRPGPGTGDGADGAGDATAGTGDATAGTGDEGRGCRDRGTGQSPLPANSKKSNSITSNVVLENQSPNDRFFS